MAGSASSQDVLQQTVNGFAQRVSEYADGIAGRLGQPLSGTQLSKDDAVQRWNFSPLGSTQAADAAYHQKVAQGMPPGQALDQVYPMRSMLYRGADTQDAISNARQIAGWAADATGQPAPQEPTSSTVPLLMAQQPPVQGAPPPMPLPGPGGLPQPSPGPMPGPGMALPAMQPPVVPTLGNLPPMGGSNVPLSIPMPQPAGVT